MTKTKEMTKQKDWEKEFDEMYYGEISKLADSELWKFCRSEKPKQIVRQLLAQKEKEVRDRERREMLQKIECLETTDINYKGLKIKGVLLNRGAVLEKIEESK